MRTFKHPGIRNLKIGEYQFKNHLLILTEDHEADEFLALLKKQPRYLSAPIREVMNLVNERPIDYNSQVTRGITGTRDIKGRTADRSAAEIESAQEAAKLRAAEAHERLVAEAEKESSAEETAEDVKVQDSGELPQNADESPPSSHDDSSAPPGTTTTPPSLASVLSKKTQ